MLMTYKESASQYGNAYQIEKRIESGVLFKIEEGFYSDTPNCGELCILIKKYPKAVLTGNYAFYYYGFTDLIPDKYTFATTSKAAPMTDPRVSQSYVRDDIFPIGVVEVEIENTKAKIYDRERMLIELLRNKNSMPYDLYKEILLHYRKIIDSLEIWRIQEYAAIFPKSKLISKALDEEVL